jgi:enterochelin esterase family protein
MATVLRQTGVDVHYLEMRDGHNWENWRNQLRDALSWVFPGPQKFVYE